MSLVYPLLLLLVALGPLFLAWSRGDLLLNRLEARKRRRRLMARLRSTRKLPLREDEMKKLLEGDARVQAIEERISQTLLRLSRLPAPRVNGIRDPARAAQGLEGPLLERESHFNTYLDAAWLQSETLDAMEGEISLLRKVAGLPEDWPRGESSGRAEPNPARPEETSLPMSASDRLMQSLRDASLKRRDIDHRLGKLRKQHGSNPASRPPPLPDPSGSHTWTA